MSAPQWKGLFEWSMKYTDGTRISEMTPEDVDPAKMAWLQEVLTSYVKDLVTRLQDIKKSLEEPENDGHGAKEQEDLLDEMHEIVEDMDQAKNLHLIGGLPLLMELLESPHASLKWRAAEIIATCVQNNLEIQKAFLEGGVLPLIMSVASSDDANCQVKGWMAVSCLIRNFPAALHAFQEREGFKQLLSTLNSDDVRLQRRGLFLLEYLLSSASSRDLQLLKETGSLQKIMRFVTSEDLDVREKAMSVLIAVATTANGKHDLQQDASFCQKLQKMQDSIEQESEEEQDSRASEAMLLEELKTALQGNGKRTSGDENRQSALKLLKP